MDLLNENRSLIHTGRLLRQPDNGFDLTNSWTELHVLLFDNYRKLLVPIGLIQNNLFQLVVMTKPKEREGVTKYQVYRRVCDHLYT